jgi:exodeoxyribonuclease V alpha subunit
MPEPSDHQPGVGDCIIELIKNYRFSEKSGIALLSRAIQDGDAHRSLSLIDEGKIQDIHFSEIIRNGEIPEKLFDMIFKFYGEYLRMATAAQVSPEDVFRRLDAFRVLCAFRAGIWGSQRINLLIEKTLSDAGLINLRTPYYLGQPIMIEQNNYRLHLFNGDVGIVLRDPADKLKKKMFFRDPKKGMRSISPERLPKHKSVWAMTVHKSQGSEFDNVALILSDADAPVLTRELLYTGITRARFEVNICSTKDIFMKTVQKQIVRQSGLTDALQRPLPIKNN